jgi:hypothetical protein
MFRWDRGNTPFTLISPKVISVYFLQNCVGTRSAEGQRRCWTVEDRAPVLRCGGCVEHGGQRRRGAHPESRDQVSGVFRLLRQNGQINTSLSGARRSGASAALSAERGASAAQVPGAARRSGASEAQVLSAARGASAAQVPSGALRSGASAALSAERGASTAQVPSGALRSGSGAALSAERGARAAQVPSECGARRKWGAGAKCCAEQRRERGAGAKCGTERRAAAQVPSAAVDTSGRGCKWTRTRVAVDARPRANSLIARYSGSCFPPAAGINIVSRYRPVMGLRSAT